MFVWLTLVLAVLSGIALLQFNAESGLIVPPELMLSCAAAVLGICIYLATAKSNARGENGLRKRLVAGGLCIAFIGALSLGFYNHAPVHNYLARTANIAPQSVTEAAGGPKSVRIRRDPNGQFVARGSINNTAAEFLVDTGAAVVLLRQTDAEKAGIDMSALTFSVPVETANGTTYAAPVRLRSLSIGPLQIAGLEALVAAPGSLNESLLGISFLRRLKSYELAGDFMTLRE